MSNEYETVTIKVENTFPSIGSKFRKELQHSYSCLSSQNLDIKTTITTHFGAYRLVKDSILDLLKTPPQGLQMSTEIGDVLSKFNNNIKSLEDHFNTNAKNNTLQIDEFGVRALLSNINQNIIALLCLF
jgi:hypothetical protein